MARHLSLKRKITHLAGILILAAVPYLIYQAVSENNSAMAWYSNIAQTEHNFTTATWGGGEICKPCHTPHNAKTGIQDAVLWAHNTSTATYSMYTSTTFNGNTRSQGSPQGRSKLCLSCHDGTVALGAYVGSTNQTLGNIATYVDTVTGMNPYIGTDLTNDHPISFTYDGPLAAADAGGLITPVSLSFVDSANQVPLFGGTLQCATCHNPHGRTATFGGVVFDKLLNKDNAGSALCLTCHLK